MATATEVRNLLAGTSLPADLVDTLLDGASALWLLAQAPEQVAGDLALCHPALRAGEVRAIAHPLEGGGGHKVSVVAPDRPGLLAGTAGALAAHGLTILTAAASSWPQVGIAVQRVMAEPAVAGAEVDWEAVGVDLRVALAGSARLALPFTPCPPVAVSCTDHGTDRAVVSVQAPDRLGLLWAIACWFEDHGCNIEVADIDAEAGTANDTFVVHRLYSSRPERPERSGRPFGPLDADALATHLAGRPAPSMPWPVATGLSAGLALGRGAIRIATFPVRAAFRR